MPPDPAPFKNKIYHGGPSGIETLRTPKFIQDDKKAQELLDKIDAFVKGELTGAELLSFKKLIEE